MGVEDTLEIPDPGGVAGIAEPLPLVSLPPFLFPSLPPPRERSLGPWPRGVSGGQYPGAAAPARLPSIPPLALGRALLGNAGARRRDPPSVRPSLAPPPQRGGLTALLRCRGPRLLTGPSTSLRTAVPARPQRGVGEGDAPGGGGSRPAPPSSHLPGGRRATRKRPGVPVPLHRRGGTAGGGGGGVFRRKWLAASRLGGGGRCPDGDAVTGAGHPPSPGPPRTRRAPSRRLPTDPGKFVNSSQPRW